MSTARKIKRIALGLVLFLVATMSAYLLVIRPWHLTWGATDEEVARIMPGDEIVPSPTFNGTRAVTVVELVMIRKCLLGIQRRAESAARL